MKIKVKIRKGQKDRMLTTSKSSAFPKKIEKPEIKKQSRMQKEEEEQRCEKM